ncbi:helicase domino-like isoform X2 [Physella acuta]|uniref:helicase domino-like isoform X2 n=1 Tax=Physella acuta TaxID=109671 RepID=UPI0027DC3553|nr:helicase domino-like isoform X2 [Physella acuta]
MQKSNADKQVVQNFPATSDQQNVAVFPSVVTSDSALSTDQPTTVLSGGLYPTTVTFTLPRNSSTTDKPLLISNASLSNTRLVSPQTINLIHQLPTGIVGLSTVSAPGVQFLQTSGTPLTFVTSNPGTAAAIEQQQTARLLQHKLQSGSVSSSGSTIHHLATASPANHVSNQNTKQNLSMSALQQSPTGAGQKRNNSVAGAMMIATSLPSSNSNTNIVTMSSDLKLFTLPQRSDSPTSTGPSPKKIKLEQKPAPNKEVDEFRSSVCSHKRRLMQEIKGRYREHLTELFYLQGGGNITEFHTWKKRPTQPLLNFLEGSKLDSDDDDELLEKRINDEVKVLTSVGSNVPLATPVAISTTLPPSVSALNQQAVNSSTTAVNLASTSLPMTSSSELQHHLTKMIDIKPSAQILKSGISSGQSLSAKNQKTTSVSPSRSRQQSISSVYESVTGGSQDVIVERAKQEAQVLQRVNELRKEGLWSAKRLPRVQEPPRQKAHWDYLLEEMTWLAADFIQERKWKKAASKKLARMVSNHFREQEQKEMRAEKEEAIKLKKIASQMAKMVKEFWTNIEKVVQYKQTQRLEEKKKKALDLHLSFIVDQTEKYSSWLTEGLQKAEGSRTSSDVEFSIDSGDEFQPVGTASDDEETIEREEIESGLDENATKREVEELQKESELPLEELLKTLPKEMLDEPSSQIPFDYESSEESIGSKEQDTDFNIEDEDEDDVEETIEEQETHEKKDYTVELDDLKAEGEMSVEELLKKYSGAYEEDLKVPEESSEDEESSGDSDEDITESEKESSAEEEEEMVQEKANENEDPVKKEDFGLEFLVKEEEKTQAIECSTEGPGKEFNDIAAAAQSLQPKGYTLETTEVKTKVPFLLKHTLREYQHVGLDWLATMHDKRLNGILADEMGLGKTIQTIAMLAHLACDKGIWGPHLIVVPTSVMLNWEMEFKKWCPAFKILTYYGSIKERKLKRQGWTKTNAFHVCITSYKLVVQDHQAFRRKKWKYFILDEAQNIKNFKSQRWQMLLNFSSQRRLLLTGTPLQNSLMELWSLMHFLMPNVFQSHSEFKEWFSNPLTGMIEGSQEYNESLVRRLHKVLRPFLLRRLKNEVEKQMPQKFEHVVMCRLSKRQRFLYDDFMSQTKTKETLATGHFMSVINILMQLRKVCNHPDLFDPRPIVSPFKMEGIVYSTASLVTRILEYDPLRDIDLYSLYPNLAEMECDLPAFVAQRVKQLKATGKMIQEVDNLADPPTRLPLGTLKNIKTFPSLAPQMARLSTTITSASTLSDTASPAKTAITTVQSTPTTVNSIKLLLPPSSSSTQQTILIPNPNGSGPPIILPLSSISSSSTSAAIAQAKLISSQLQSGVLQLVQTSTGHQILTTASITSSSSLSSVTTTSALSSTPLSTTSNTNVSLLKLSTVHSQQKPVMRVSPFVISAGDVKPLSPLNPPQTAVIPSTNLKTDSQPIKLVPKKPMKKSELFLESLYRKKEERRQHILALMSRLNQSRCDRFPVYGPDTHDTVNCVKSLDAGNCSTPHPSSCVTNLACDVWRKHGYVDCLFAQNRLINHNYPDVFWRECSHLKQIVNSPEEWLSELTDVLSRFVFVTPTVISPAVSLRVSCPDPSHLSKMNWMEAKLRPVIVEKSANLHPIQSRTMVTFPELRLIQYDCGKLQTLDLLLRQLKSGQHRVLIFTQMTKMLDVLESFLNFHGHRYLRLDGTTKVEQRQYLMDRFNADPRIFCFILSTRSGGIGVNLTGADTVVFYDSDWNPTMDAQAQDRCHRIGQTRDVHIYRLVSEMTVEENILKKANQKRLLGDLAIEGGNFTTAFFKEQTITDLFAEPSGLESLVEDKEREKEAKEKDREAKLAALKQERENEEKREREESKKEAAMLSQFEQALCKAEDETDALAATQVQAEQKAELAEFDENIPWDEREADIRKEEEEVSRVEIELAMIDKELTPIERYAVTVMEAQMEPETAEELKIAEEDIENSKKDWELARLKALKEEEERRAELEEDEMLYIYSKDESQMFVSGFDGAEMPMWCPPTPPQDDNDIYMDETLSFLYEPRVMPEQTLPPVYVPKAHKKPKTEAITTRKQKQRKEEQPRVPRSLFDKPKEVVMKQRRDAKMQRLRQNLQLYFHLIFTKQVSTKIMPGRAPLGQQQQQQQPPPPTPVVAKPEPDPNYPEWLVHEEWALLEAVQHIQKLNPDLLIDNPAQIVNWDFVSDFVSVVGRIFRAAKHCRYQYEYVVLPREDGKILYNLKQKKTPKSIYKSKNTRPLRTEQLYSQEGLKNFSQLFDIRFAAMTEIGTKRPAAMRQTIVNPAAKPTKHAAILADNGINYDSPMLPSQLAAKRAERIALDKKKQQQAAAAQAQAASANAAAQDATVAAQRPVQAAIVATGVTPAIQGQQLSSIVSVTPTTIIAGQVPKVATVGPGLTAVSIARTLGAAAGNIIVNAGLQSGPFAAINKRMSQASLPSTIAVSANLTPTIRGQRPAVAGTPTITMQDLGVTGVTSTAVTVAAQAAAARSALQTTVASSLAAGQKLAALTATATTLQPQLVQTRNLTPQQINILRQQNQSIIRAQAATGTQQIRGQKLLTTDQLRAQQIKQHPKVITQQLLVPFRGHSILSKQGLLRATATIPKMTDEQLQALRMRTQIQTQQGKQLQTAQIVQGQVATINPTGASPSQTPVALVKSVSASPAVTVPVTIPVTAINVATQRTVVAASRATTVSQIQQQRMQLLQQQQRKVGAQQKVAGLATGKPGQQIPLLINQHTKLNTVLAGNQILHQIGLVNKQLITHGAQPTIITQVSQAGGQPIQQVVAKVSLQSGNQTIAAGTPITVTHVSSTGNLGLAGQGAVKTATITSLDGGTSGIQVHSVQPGQKSVSGLPQNIQTVQVQQVTSAQGTSYLQVTPSTVQSQSTSQQPQQQTTVTLPASLVAATLRPTATTLPSTSRSQTPTQISLVPASTPTSVTATISAVQVQAATPAIDVTSSTQVIAQNVPTPAAMATVVTQTSQPDSAQGAAQKASPYAMRTRNTKH